MIKAIKIVSKWSDKSLTLKKYTYILLAKKSAAKGPVCLRKEKNAFVWNRCIKMTEIFWLLAIY
jgi:hypothetical protein